VPTYPIQVRWGDMDALAHVNNVAYVQYLEQARVHLIESGGFGDPLDIRVVVARHELDYVAPLTYRAEPVLCDIWVSEIRRRSFRLEYVIRDEQRTYVRAATVMVGYDAGAGRSRDLDAGELAALKALLRPADAAAVT
jgi:YbgC/YbaW family acyl-CoA thioester hydrolase